MDYRGYLGAGGWRGVQRSGAGLSGRCCPGCGVVKWVGCRLHFQASPVRGFR